MTSERDPIFIRSLRSVNKIGEISLPRKSTRRFLLHLGLVAAVVVPIGHDFIERSSNPLEQAIEKQGDKVGKKVDDANIDASEKLEEINVFAKDIHTGWQKIQPLIDKLEADQPSTTTTTVAHRNENIIGPVIARQKP